MIPATPNKKAFAVPVIILVMILVLGSAFLGSQVNAYVGSKKVQEPGISLDDYLQNDRYRGVRVYRYDCHDEQLQKWSYGRNFTCRVNGFYDVADIIFLNTHNRTDGDVLTTLFHEYGHHLWRKVLSDEDKALYREVYLDEARFASDYALTGGLEEDFAESYKARMLYPENLPSGKADFFLQMLEKYHEF